MSLFAFTTQVKLFIFTTEKLRYILLTYICIHEIFETMEVNLMNSSPKEYFLVIYSCISATYILSLYLGSQ